MTARHFNLPVVYVRMNRSLTIPDMVSLTIVPSRTKGIKVEIIVLPEYLKPDETMLDDDKLNVMVNDVLVDYAYER